MQNQQQGSKTILLADDEDMVRAIIKLILGKAGYNMAEAVDGQDALEKFTEDPERYALVMLDQQMPRLDGQEALARMRRISPQLKAILVSGAMDEAEAQDRDGEPNTRVMHKPFENKELLRVVGELAGAGWGKTD